jgi:serralysin
MAKIMGTGANDLINTDDSGVDVYGRAGRDDIVGGQGNDSLLAGGGDDVVSGGAGDDVIYGSNKTPGGFNQFRVAEDYTAHVVFQGESAGYRNTLGAYTYDAEGNITGVKILFANASLIGSGGDLESGKSGVDMALAKGERLGFFVVPNAFSQSDLNAKLVSQTEGKFQLTDAAGNNNVIDAKGGLTLSWVDASGKVHAITSQYGAQVFHSLVGLNQDGLDHVKTKVDTATGQVTIGFEDLLNGGDKDFDDSVFTVDIGMKNAEQWANQPDALATDNDKLSGGEGNDRMHGMRGNDTLDGGIGNDLLFGNSGDDQMTGGDGDDQMGGGKGNDTLSGNAGNDLVRGDSGADMLRDGLGDDTVKAGTDDDTVYAGSGGKDAYEGGKGNDTIDFGEMGGKHGIKLNLSKSVVTNGLFTDTVKGFEIAYGTELTDKMTGSKRAESLFGDGGDDVLRGKLGNDVLTGGDGRDTFEFQKGDWARGQVDHITDFQKGQDVLDLNEIISGKIGKNGAVQLTDAADGTHLSVVISGKFQQIAILDDVHGLTVADLNTAGSLLI